MNPIALIRQFAESYAEGERVKAFGLGYKDKQEALRLENEGRRIGNVQAKINVEQDLARFPQEQELTELKLKVARGEATDDEVARAATLKAARDDYYSAGPQPTEDTRTDEEARADYESKSVKMKREAETLAQNAAIRKEQEAVEANIGPEARAYLGVDRDRPVSPLDVEVLTGKRREEAAVRAAAQRHSYGLSPTDPTSIAAVDDAADRVAAGEMSIADARSLLGGVRGGLGQALIKALGDRRIIPPTVRKDLVSVQTTRNIVDTMEELVDGIINAPTPEERLKRTALLEQYGQTTGTLLSRGFGERGVVTDRDVARATGLVPGWKAANFAPEYAKREIALLREVLDRNETGISAGYFQTQSRTTGTVTKGATPGVEEYVRDPKTGKLVRKTQ